MEQPQDVVSAEKPEPTQEETRVMKSKCSRAGLSVAVLYGAVGEAQSISMILMALVAIAWAVFEPSAFAGLLEYVKNPWMLGADLLNNSALVTVLLSIFLGVQAVAWGVGFVLMRLVLPPKKIEKKNLSFGRFLLIALITFGVWGAGAVIGNLSAFFGVEQDSLFSVEYLGKSLLPYLLYAVIGAPIVEELAFRKALLDGLHGMHEGYAAVLSGLLFGLMHGNHMQFFLAFFIGMLFAMVYQRTGRIVYTMLLHGMINLTGTLPELLALWNIDISLGWNIVVCVLIAAGLLALFLLRKDPLLHAEPTTVPDANRAVFDNLGMRITRIAGLILVGGQGLLLLFVSLYNTDARRWGFCLIDLIPMGLVFLTVLLLPKFTKRYEAKPSEPTEDVL